MKNVKISLVITTYNRPKALNVVLLSVLNQTVLPNELIIADDGSTDETRLLIENFQKSFPIPLVHSWQEDNGFRLSASRNKAIAKASNDYIILIDGDMLLHRRYIEDYLKAIRHKRMYISSRVFLNEERTKEIEDTQDINVTCNDKGIAKNKMNGIRLPFAYKLLPNIKRYTHAKGYMAFFKKDCIAINGFDEDYEGWGREDSDFLIRMMNSGIIARKMKWRCISYHLYHKEADRSQLLKNDERLQKVIQQKKVKCSNGINKYFTDIL